MEIKYFLKKLGPGLLYAAAAVGVSHLVQSTRAGADFSFDLIPFLIIAMVIKYPFFEFAPRYTNATGKDLITAYREMGTWAVALFALITLFTMFAIVAAVVMVTAGVAGFVFNMGLNPVYISALLMFVSAMVLIIGRYHLLDRVIKYVIAVLALSTIFAVISAFGTHAETQAFFTNFSFSEKPHIFFLIAFIGWMPSPIDVSVWHSLWSKAKGKDGKISVRDGQLDFRIGYIGTGFVALAFLSLGAVIMFNAPEHLADSGVAFSAQLINMYTISIGSWAYPVIAVAAVATMFSTTLTVIDAYPRVMTPITTFFIKKWAPYKKPLYWVWMAVTIGGTLLLMSLLSHSMSFMVDLATTLSFVTAPVVAILNYKAVTSKNFPAENKPGKGLLSYAQVGIVFLILFSLFYIVYLIIA